MRRELWWGLGASSALSVWVLLNPASSGGSPRVIAPAPPSEAKAPSPIPVPSEAQGHVLVATGAVPAPNNTEPFDTATASGAPLPARWPEPAMESAKRNPFLAPLPPVPKPVVVKVVVAPPPPPPAPTLTYRFWGGMTTPEGARVLYVAHGDNGPPVAVQAGTRLEDGFVIEQIVNDTIVLVHSGTQQRFTVSQPPPSAVSAH